MNNTALLNSAVAAGLAMVVVGRMVQAYRITSARAEASVVKCRAQARMEMAEQMSPEVMEFSPAVHEAEAVLRAGIDRLPPELLARYLVIPPQPGPDEP